MWIWFFVFILILIKISPVYQLKRLTHGRFINFLQTKMPLKPLGIAPHPRIF